MGASFRDLLPFLRIQPVISETAQALRDLDAMTQACADAIAAHAPHSVLQKLLATSDEGWRRAMGMMLKAGARGEDVTALTEAFDRLREARAAVIAAQSRRSR
jgi:hypothetical protein